MLLTGRVPALHDHRLVQTAVIGQKNSDLPIILPMDAFELDIWRKRHPDYTYWCGLQLGGCGGELSDRRYTNKVCHFAHQPDAPVCRRKATGESSADHLFIKQGVRRLMEVRKLKGKVQTYDLGTGPGDAVDVYLADSRRRLRFQLSAVDYRTWRSSAEDLGAQGGDIDWIFGTEGPVTQQFLGRQGYCLRVRCETVGGERRVDIGAEARDRTVAWTPLEDCTLTPSGIVTPHVEEIRLSRPLPRPIAFPVQGSVVFAPVPGAMTPERSPFEENGRRLLLADVKPVDGPIVRTVVSLPGDTDSPPAEHVYRVSEGARVLMAEDGGGWAVKADRYQRLNAHEAQRTGLWTPPPGGSTEPVAATAPRREQPAGRNSAGAPTVAQPSKKALKRAAKKLSEKVSEKAQAPRGPSTRPKQVNALREALRQSARRGRTTTWEELARTVGRALDTCTTEDRISLLLDVDQPLWENVPVLSALVRENGAPPSYLPRLLSRLGVADSERSSQITRWADVEADRAFAAYAKPARLMRPRLSLRPERRVPQQREQETAPQQPTKTRTAPAVKEPRAEPKVQNPDDTRRVRALVTRLDALIPGLGKDARRPAIRALGRAEAWLAYREGERRPQGQQQKKVACETPEFVVSLLEYTLREAERGRESAGVQGQRRATAPAAPHRSAEQAKAAAGDPVEWLTRQLIGVAALGQTIPALHLDGGVRRPDLRQRMESLDSQLPHDVPVLSALVLGADGGPVPFFRDVLGAAGLAVPSTDEALRRVWRREQERAHAAYGNPPRELPPRLTPEASSWEGAGVQ
ncbi:hypothetical protein [Streptomyces sp. NBC_00887]|uniref:hypothetical protein n=1 Tax=Streptomyces sp. NBC_00887 TaxID=2975859 RepID=UPI00386AA3E6|nr:hypothetical protein OG844_07620 [Streptomyces sp. NBC_00887]WSY35096.1 hypothetical protein OG844_37980 [Streptomyces sp. NBC_00887]